MNDKVARFLEHLRCPRTGTPLRVQGDQLVSEAGESYPIVRGKPILVRKVEHLHVTPPPEAVTSRNIPEYRLRTDVAALGGPALHLGCGNVPCTDPSVLSLDILPAGAVDIVCEAEALPFAPNSIAAIESGAVFEHLYDPLAAIREIRRILRPGGLALIDTAFMQGYHGFPGHYFNMTPQAAETFLIDDFELVTSAIPFSGNPTFHIENSVRRFIDGLSEPDRTRLKSSTVAHLLTELGDHERARSLNGQLTEHVRRALAASVMVHARKPDDYEVRRAQVLAAIGEDTFARLKREYYAARVGLIERYGEIEFYRKRSLEMGGSPDGRGPSATLERLLLRAKPADPLDPASWQAATRLIADLEAELASIRDEWIRHFLVRQEDWQEAAPLPEPIDLLQRLEEERRAAAETLSLLTAELRAEREVKERYEAELSTLHQSRSWQVTAPLRWLRRLMGGIG